MNWNNFKLKEIIKNALEEDIGTGDLTTTTLIPANQTSQAVIKAKEAGVIAGLEVAKLVFRSLNTDIEFQSLVEEGTEVTATTKIAQISGATADLLRGERVALNFLQRMSGIATQTKQICDLVADFDLRIVDTRKTTPGLRILEKYAVRVGGGFNHRQGLYDAVMIKDNHLQAVGSIERAVAKVRSNLGHTVKIEVETENLAQVKEALQARADIILLDNMKLEVLESAVDLIGERAIAEASGGINTTTVQEVAQTGVDVISIGALTHSSSSLDISLDLQ
ncbi:MAG: carboxylating nicotinate-nucleotide diphosphorylase [Bacillota bacterium]